jgi:hypothetical protein
MLVASLAITLGQLGAPADGAARASASVNYAKLSALLGELRDEEQNAMLGALKLS